MYGENAKKGILSNVTVSCLGSAKTTPPAPLSPPTKTTTTTAATELTMETCGKLTVQPVTEKQAFVLDTSGHTAGLVHYQSKTSRLCLAAAAARSPAAAPGMPGLELASCDATAPGQRWMLNITQRLLVSELHSCDGGPECVLSEYGDGGYKAGDSVVLYGTYGGQFGVNQVIAAAASPTGLGAHQLVVAAAGLCVTGGGKPLPPPPPPFPPPPPPPPPGAVIPGPWLHRNGTVGEFHRLFMPEVAAAWRGWRGASSGSPLPVGKPMVWLMATFDAPPPPAAESAQQQELALPLALKMGNATTKGRAWVNGMELGMVPARKPPA